ncbi:MAG TPA: DUF4388 domain-containing protein [Thermoanaerobaculia bacterium]|nr:DUF4388 domain-containing protein [Thermoanaerobaculia bacterium]
MGEQLRGRLEVFGLADLLQWMELNRRSGRLTISRGADRRTLDWQNGEIVYVSGSLPRHRLGVHLLRSGALPAATLYELLARNFTRGPNLSLQVLRGGHDTHEGLSLRIEELARRLLFEMFDWHDARFEYDPDCPVQPILRIGLSMRGQALAFQGVKNLDDTARGRPRRPREDESDPREIPFDKDQVEERFWDLLARAGTSIHPDEARRLFGTFEEFSRRVRGLVREGPSMRPIFEDSAGMLAEILAKSPFDREAVVSVAALAPNLTLDLLTLANALVVDRDNALATAPEAIERLGSRATAVLVERLTASDFPRVPETERSARAVRRASIAAAVSAGRYAERFGITRERGYTLGLLHAACYSDLFEILHTLEFPAGAFRAATIEAYRRILGARLAETWGLPFDFQAVLADDGTDPSAAASLVRTARAALPGCALGPVSREPVDPLWSEEIASEVQMVFEFLGLGTVKLKTG